MGEKKRLTDDFAVGMDLRQLPNELSPNLLLRLMFILLIELQKGKLKKVETIRIF